MMSTFFNIIIVNDEEGMFIIVIVISRDHICYRQYKQCLCKIIITRVKADFVDVV